MYDHPARALATLPPSPTVDNNNNNNNMLASNNMKTTAVPPLTIQLPLPTVEKFAWSDFPIASSDDLVDFSSTSNNNSSSSSSLSPDRKRRRPRSSFFDDGFEDVVANSGGANRRSSYSSSSLSYSNSIICSLSTVGFDDDQQQQQQQRKRVRFADKKEIRTYNIVLGNHDWCEDGYAIECGNDVLSVDYADASNNYSSSSRLHRRSYLERKYLLIEVGGYTENQLEDEVFELKQHDNNNTIWHDDNDYDGEYDNDINFYNQNLNVGLTSGYYYDDDDIHCHNNSNNKNLSVGLFRVKSIDSCLSRVLNTIANAAA